MTRESDGRETRVCGGIVLVARARSDGRTGHSGDVMSSTLEHGASRRDVAPSLVGATGWLNSDPLTPDELRGSVVLYAFWTYTCINWLRTSSYVRAWAAKYRDAGLVVVGVHTPEFVFEQDVDNVRSAIAAHATEFPVVLDNDYAIWRSFDNHYWPAFYLADHRGLIRYAHFGEGRYGTTERAIKQLLAEIGAEVDHEFAVTSPAPDEIEADWDDLDSIETYLGYERSDAFDSAEPLQLDTIHRYVAPNRLVRNSWALSGEWTVHADRIIAGQPGGVIRIRFHARDLHLVMGPGDDGAPVSFRVTIDGHVLGQDHGADVDENGVGTMTEPRMYQLIRQTSPIEDSTAEIDFRDAGAQAFVVTFG
jgi:hypothetical protein